MFGRKQLFCHLCFSVSHPCLLASGSRPEQSAARWRHACHLNTSYPSLLPAEEEHDGSIITCSAGVAIAKQVECDSIMCSKKLSRLINGVSASIKKCKWVQAQTYLCVKEMCVNMCVWLTCGHLKAHIQWVKIITMRLWSQVESDYFTVFV